MRMVNSISITKEGSDYTLTMEGLDFETAMAIAERLFHLENPSYPARRQSKLRKPTVDYARLAAAELPEAFSLGMMAEKMREIGWASLNKNRTGTILTTLKRYPREFVQEDLKRWRYCPQDVSTETAPIQNDQRQVITPGGKAMGRPVEGF